MKKARIKEEETCRMIFTAKELAERFGCDKDTIHHHAVKLFGAGEPRKTRYFDEAQVTAILESIKQGYPNQYSLPQAAAVVETEITDEYRLVLLYKQDADIMREAAVIEKKLRLKMETRAQQAEAAYGREVLDHKATRNLLDERETGLEMLQRIAEAGGLITTDREDILSAHRSVR